MKVKSESEVIQSCPTLSDPVDCSPPGSSTHGIFQARVLEWVAIAFSQSNPSLAEIKLKVLGQSRAKSIRESQSSEREREMNNSHKKKQQ